MPHPLTDPWTGPFGLPAFEAVRDDDFLPAFEDALARARERIAAIAANPEPPTFDNTLAALERADAELDRVARIFFNLAGADSNPAREAIQRKVAPMLAAYSSEVAMNRDLFARIDAVNGARDDLDPEAARLTELTHRNLIRGGAALEGADRDRYAAIMQRLAELGTAFSQNLLADERGWSMPVDADGLQGLSADLVAAMAAAAKERGQEGHVVTLSRSIIVPFLEQSPRRDLREAAQKAWAARGANGGETDNGAIVAETLALRAERAAMLGFDDFASYKLAPQMAKTPDAVRELLMAVWNPARARAGEEETAIAELMAADGINGPVEPWDWRYYAAKLRARDFDIDEAAVKAHFTLSGMIDAAFDCANRLFGLTFAPLHVPLYHPDARAFEVRRGGRTIAVFIGDWFARPSKRSGAWCSSFASQSRLDGETLPIAVNVCNFARPPAGEAALLSYDDARTLFHEFGHALHVMLSDVTYPSLSGTSVARDFVELPSQLYEHWLEVPEVLDRFARHHATGAPIPAELRDKVLAARNAGQGFATVEYLASAIVDLDFHTGTPPADPMAAQAGTLARIGQPNAIPMRHATPHFAHVFSGDSYAAGYYSYMWSEVMDADAFAAFEEAGDPFDAETAERLRANIYAAGGTRDEAALYTAFRGRLPGVEAILRQRGFA